MKINFFHFIKINLIKLMKFENLKEKNDDHLII